MYTIWLSGYEVLITADIMQLITLVTPRDISQSIIMSEGQEVITNTNYKQKNHLHRGIESTTII